jgi:hypothetical protein
MRTQSANAHFRLARVSAGTYNITESQQCGIGTQQSWHLNDDWQRPTLAYLNSNIDPAQARERERERERDEVGIDRHATMRCMSMYGIHDALSKDQWRHEDPKDVVDEERPQ